jgi:hypothetical protein
MKTYPHYTFTCFIFISLIAVSCKKNNQNIKANLSGVSFTCVSDDIIGDTIKFTSIAPSGSSYMWHFGDSGSSAEANPTHVYTAAGTYIVALTIDNDTTVQAMINIFNNPVYTSQIAGTKSYKHVYLQLITEPDTITYIESLPIGYINPALVSFLGNTFIYSPSLSHDSVLAFEYYSSLFLFGIQREYDHWLLLFNHTSNSINCIDSDWRSAGLYVVNNYTSQ